MVKDTCTEVPRTQSSINKFVNWSVFYFVLVCIDKWAVMPFGSANERFNYICDGKNYKSCGKVLGITRS